MTVAMEVAPLATAAAGQQPEPLLSELSRTGAPGHQLPCLDVPEANDLECGLVRSELRLPEVGELDGILEHRWAVND